MNVRAGPSRSLSAEGLMLLNCGAGETLESPLGVPVNPVEFKPSIFIGRIDLEAKAPILWPFDVKS